eukprot:XP_001704363.1 Hypothetical protein GL50803_135965 [Giardia lamblia ATCC 50803]
MGSGAAAIELILARTQLLQVYVKLVEGGEWLINCVPDAYAQASTGQALPHGSSLRAPLQ